MRFIIPASGGRQGRAVPYVLVYACNTAAGSMLFDYSLLVLIQERLVVVKRSWNHVFSSTHCYGVYETFKPVKKLD